MTIEKKARIIAVLIFCLTSPILYSQTCKVRNATLENGRATYIEAFEYDYVDKKPEFPGGGKSLIKFINSTREYPIEAYEMGIEGRVTCAFIVNCDGKISNIQVLRGVEPSLNHEAMRIVSAMPQWIPGELNNEPVPVRVVCCIPFSK
ncbi:MAG: energy transducer TonB [Muribaculaceae bacterium]|nr:energy transducer TonB [Muribaculaceae bacterium]